MIVFFLCEGSSGVGFCSVVLSDCCIETVFALGLDDGGLMYNLRLASFDSREGGFVDLMACP